MKWSLRRASRDLAFIATHGERTRRRSTLLHDACHAFRDLSSPLIYSADIRTRRPAGTSHHEREASLAHHRGAHGQLPRTKLPQARRSAAESGGRSRAALATPRRGAPARWPKVAARRQPAPRTVFVRGERHGAGRPGRSGRTLRAIPTRSLTRPWRSPPCRWTCAPSPGRARSRHLRAGRPPTRGAGSPPADTSRSGCGSSPSSPADRAPRRPAS